MKISRIAFAAIAAVAVAVAGCSKIHEKKDFTLEPGNSHNLKITAPLSEQKLTVALTSDQPVSIWVLLEKDVPGGKDDLDPTTLKSGILASKTDTKEVSLDVTIPAKEAYRIIIAGAAKKAAVTVKIDSK